MAAALYLDEDWSPSIAEALRNQGFDVVSAHELGRLHVDDEDHLAYATQHDRVLVSFNFHDYQRIAENWTAVGQEYAGIVLSFRQLSREETGIAVRAIARMLAAVREEEFRNMVTYLNEYLRDAN